MPAFDVPEASLSEAEFLCRLFPNGGEMGARIRQLDWSATQLGPVHGWPQSLRTAVAVMLGSRIPMMVHWGPELVHFYNDGYATILHTKHPGALGQPAAPWWAEMWPFLLTIFEPVLAGQTTYFENGLVLPNRQGFVEETYFTFSHSPLYDEKGAVAGIFVTALETTASVLQQRRLALLSHLTAQTALATSPAETAQHLIGALATNPHDIPFALLYTHELRAEHAHLRAWFGVPAGEPAAPAALAAASPLHQAWPVADALRQAEPLLVPSIAERLGALPAGDWPVPPQQALLLPVSLGEGSPESAVLVVGLSARLPLNEAYRSFLSLVADYAGRALARAQAAAEDRRLTQALREMNASLDSFVHIVAHDLRGPVTNLRGLADAYADEEPGPAREHLVALVRHEAGRLSDTVQGLLQVLRAQYEAPVAEAEVAAWADLYAGVHAELAEYLRQQHGTVVTDFAAAPRVHYPPAYAASILKNLVHNALKYRSPHRPPVVRIQTRRDGQAVVLTVADNGRGIDLPRDHERLFQPFTRLTGEGEGAGLGLHLIRTLIQQRGGTLTVASTPNVGTTFTVVLPGAALPR
ncbi:sensor histidine kinase [Hymenobacter ruricola]|uniref:histidine kinase n=1 Tax=Hymenobacter ruricola TaxID=2791023 RepID=A0ABS0I3S3_9BACT|nr:HAMP domain-containing sensor histidine kinase [Hymenobacter ruricola]MBF9221592.1 HAMP domain-containing histidine kinase [Hymenobacter ruricola]